jgi:uncharacterized protein (TIGR00369 family)
VAKPRSRTFSWSDPDEALIVASGLPGLEMLRRMISGELALPPITALMSMRLVEAEPGRVVWEALPGEEHYNPIGTVHAGFATTLLDSTMGTAFVSTAEAGTHWTTLELKANFTRAITADTGTVRCIGSVVHGVGRSSPPRPVWRTPRDGSWRMPRARSSCSPARCPTEVGHRGSTGSDFGPTPAP